MNRKEFMEKLASLLSDISESEREEALKYYNDYFNDAGEENEQTVIESLGTPEQVAKTVKEGMGENKAQGEFTEKGFTNDADSAQKNEVIKTENVSDSAAKNTASPEKPPKKPLPAWAIVLIIVGSMLLISAAIFIFITVKVIKFAKNTGEKVVEIVEESQPYIEDAIKNLPENIEIPETLDNIKDYLPDDLLEKIPDNMEESTDGASSAAESVIFSEHFQTEDVSSLDFNLGAGKFIIKYKETDDGLIDVNIKGSGKIKCTVDDKTLKIHSAKNVSIGIGGLSKNTAEILIPDGYSFDEVQLELGACSTEITGLNAKEIEAKIGAGELIMQSINADELDLDVGAGTASVNDTVVKDADIKVGMGETNFSGSILNELETEVGMGTITYVLEGKESDHNYNIACAMGAVEIGSNSISSVSKAKYIDNGASSEFDISCGMGSILMTFAE